MKRVMVAVLLLPVFVFAGEKKTVAWNTGRLISVESDPITKTTGGGTSGRVDDKGDFHGHTSLDQMNGHLFRLAVDDRTYTYFAEKADWDGHFPLFGHHYSPVFTENVDVKWRLEKDNFIILDDNGKEFRMKLTKKRKDDAPAQPATATPAPQ
jgi:hypothetical protein